MSSRIKILVFGVFFVFLELFLLALISCNYTASQTGTNRPIRVTSFQTEDGGFKRSVFYGRDIIQSELIYPHPICTVPSYAAFQVKPLTPDEILDVSSLRSQGSTEVSIYTCTDSFRMYFDVKGGQFEIPFNGIDYSPLRIVVKRGDRQEEFMLTLYSERWMEVFCDWNIQCAILWEGARPRYWTTVSTGKDNWTKAEHCRIFSKSPVAYFVLNRAPMRYWLGFQEIHGTINGTHAPLSGTWWRLGRQGSHGCIRNPLAENFYALLDTGHRVELHYSYSEGFSLREINPAWEYIVLEPLDTLQDTMSNKVYTDEARKRLLPIFNEIIQNERNHSDL
ncbi:L,D-transpeptidase [candidate division WOR-3 bacterium]|nr:L,D-transpeptidase [candidate division WOR-3 bacterium]